jgi:hypothetical protein
VLCQTKGTAIHSSFGLKIVSQTVISSLISGEKLIYTFSFNMLMRLLEKLINYLMLNQYCIPEIDPIHHPL